MSFSLKYFGIGLGQALGFGALIPDPLTDINSKVSQAKNRLDNITRNESFTVSSLLLKTQEQQYSSLQRYTDAQVSTLNLMNEFTKENVQLNQISIISLSFLVMLIFFFGFVLNINDRTNPN